MEEKLPLRWLVTAGPTREDIDRVRFISNRSSGRMGYAVARSAAERGDEVSLVSGPVALEPPPRVETVRVMSAHEMHEAVVRRFGSSDVVVMAAAVADYRPKRRLPGKIRKTRSGLRLELEPTDDILAELGRRKAGRVLVGFALEAPDEGREGLSGPMRLRAERKLVEKGLDAVVLNGPAALGAETSAVSVLRAGGGWEDWGEAGKDAHARRLVELAAALAGRRRA
jgi:phosphopantothenoylcysteine decarboxylase/phosphopantothenate--cysteine ligase